MNNILESIEKEYTRVEEIRKTLPEIKKIKLHTGLTGFDSPNVYGIFKNTGGNALGISKESYTPVNLQMLLDVLVESITSTGLDLNLNDLEYKEYKGGKKVTFSLPLQKFELKTPMVGDILETKLVFTTGFDTMTKSSISYFTKRLWCLNGASRYDNGYAVSYKNTKNNADKYLMFTDEIVKTSLDVSNYVEKLNILAKKTISQKEIDDFYMNIFGINRTTYTESHKRSQNIFDRINECVAIEEGNTGMSAFSLLAGVTRYTTHELAENDEDLMFSTPAHINSLAHQLLLN